MLKLKQRLTTLKVHFLTVIPSLPYYASLGLAYSAELPAMDDLKAEAKSQLEAIIKKFNLPADRVQAHVAEGSPKDKILEMAKITGRYGDYRLASPGYYYLSVGFQRRSRCASCGMLRTGGTLNTRARIRECGLKSIIIA
ncbi:universal stress protein F [Salmonella enterica subsp. enterica serovar Gaminara str. ATCC BAA-711]|nr:universal stress protein F [Salmonella enterica subsp. enterica serovar Gaminara str. ATCC BAA-711]